ncbi:hypothetical protein F8M41_014135 [Gigaspora margarita]|uniref:Uncharacterized protein n=1 Tax=Gigaspora margarita TaxID=4874 RepID=A0A8H4EP28_GIGMA|nr:hypothetical protein F8M41_014135 [Gigaspora margarita]
MLIRFLGKIYKNEPTSLLIFRRSVIVISIGFLIAILVVLCIEFHDELPSVNTRFTSSDYLPLPNIHFYHDYNFTIDCLLMDNTHLTRPRICSDYIIKTMYNNFSSDRPYYGAFLSNYNATFSTGETIITLNIYITNSTYNVSNQISSMVMTAFDQEYDIYMYPKYSINGGIPPPFEESLIWKNMYFLSQPTSDRNIYYWRFTRTIKYAIISDIWNYIGTPNYIKQPYIESNIQAVPFADTIFNESVLTNSSTQANRVLYAKLQFAADPITSLKEEREQKSKTAFLAVFGVLLRVFTYFYLGLV